MRGATSTSLALRALNRYFNPRTPCGVRPATPITTPRPARNFNPRTPCGVRLVAKPMTISTCDFNPRTPCGVRQEMARVIDWLVDISIHAPHAGCDKRILLSFISSLLFQSTHPMRGATGKRIYGGFYIFYFNPRTPCGVRHHIRNNAGFNVNFNPRTPCGVRHMDFFYRLFRNDISIHAPHAGCDRSSEAPYERRSDFNPRTPCGVRQESCSASSCYPKFQSTHPMRGATKKKMDNSAKEILFQSTHPMRGATIII